jgi:YidC/Oxa1 family membrane protein insertase
MKELEVKYKDQPDVLMKESMKLMKTGGMWPLKWCLGILVQLPVFIGLLYVIQTFASGTIATDSIYSFLVPLAWKFTELSSINHRFLGMDLFANHNIALTVIWCIFVYAQTKLTMMFQAQQPKAAPAVGPNGKAMPDMSKMMWPMNIFMVFMMGTFIWSTQNGVWLYLVTTTIFSVIQYSIQNREMLKIKWMTRNVKTSASGQVISQK